MPLISIPYTVDGKILSGIVLVTKEEYKFFLDNTALNTTIIPLDFLQQYLKSKDVRITNPEEKSVGLVLAGEKYFFAGNEKFVTLQFLKNCLEELKIPYEEFIDAYSIYLKSL